LEFYLDLFHLGLPIEHLTDEFNGFFGVENDRFELEDTLLNHVDVE